MQNLLKTAAVITTLAILAACGAKSSSEGGNKSIAGKKIQLEKLKTQQREINDKVSALEEELIKLDPSLKKENKKLVAVSSLVPGSFTHYIDLQGRVDANNIAYVAPRGPGGLVKAVYVKQGQSVNKGQLLLKLDDAILQRQIDQLNTQLAYAKDLLQRQQNLWDQKIGTEVQLLTAKNNVANIEKQLATAKEQLSFSNVYAEIGGVAETVNIKVGETFTGGPQIRIVNTNDLKLITQVPENYMEVVGVGSPLVISLPETNNKTINTKITVAANSLIPTAGPSILKQNSPWINHYAQIRLLW